MLHFCGFALLFATLAIPAIAQEAQPVLAGTRVEIESFEQDRYEGKFGIVYQGDLNLNLELVKRGHAWAYRQYMRKSDSELYINEAAPRTAKRGLWALPQNQWIAPREWRRFAARVGRTRRLIL
jgi:micrococcal nuclease